MAFNQNFAKSSFIILLFCSSILTCHCQTVCGQFEALTGKPAFTSTAIIHIESIAPQAHLVRHDTLIGTNLIIERCFEGNNLFRLKSFADMPEHAVFENVVSNIFIEADPEVSEILKLEFRAANPSDAKVVLANVIVTYQKHLNAKAEAMRSERLEAIKRQEDWCRQEGSEVDKKIDLANALREEIATESYPRSESLTQRLVTNRNLMSQKQHRLILLVDCIASGPDKQVCEEMVWNLVQWNEIKESDLEDQNPLRVLEKVGKKISIETAWLKSEIAFDSKELERLTRKNELNQKIAAGLENLNTVKSRFDEEMATLKALRMEIESQSKPFRFTLLKEASLGSR